MLLWKRLGGSNEVELDSLLGFFLILFCGDIMPVCLVFAGIFVYVCMCWFAYVRDLLVFSFCLFHSPSSVRTFVTHVCRTITK